MSRTILKNKVLNLLQSHSVDLEKINHDLIILFEEYEITERTTEVALSYEAENQAFIERYIIAKLVAGLSEKSIKYYSNTLRFILIRIGKGIHDISSDDIRYYLALRQRRDHISKVSANNELTILRGFYRYLLLEELVTRDPCSRIDSIKMDQLQKDCFTEIEIERMRSVITCSRDKAAFELLLSTGCRMTELVQIEVGHIQENRIKVLGKGSKHRTVFINAKAQFAINTWMLERKCSNNRYLFPGRNHGTHLSGGALELLIHNIGQRVAIHAHPHKFRRTCATMALRRGMRIEQISKMLGHASIDTTKIYLDMQDLDLEIEHKRYVV